MKKQQKQKKKRSFGVRLLRFLGSIILIVVVLAALLLGSLTVAEYKPDAVEIVSAEGWNEVVPDTGKTLTVLSWNTGYGALGDNADFFMDGGKGVKTATQARVEENMKNMLDIAEEIDPDVLFIQETDRSSTRSYKIDETRLWKNRFASYTSVFANNFKVSFVPYPVPPIGKVDSGLLTLSRFEMKDEKGERIALPCPFSWPLRIANLKRCLLISRVAIPDSDKELVLINLHLEAYDSGEGKIAQTNMLKEILKQETDKGNYVIAGGDFNQTFSTVDMSAYPVLDGMWQPGIIDASDFDDSVQLVMDSSTPTCRSLDRPYAAEDPSAFQFYMIDGFIVSSNLTVKRCVTLDESFLSTDHNPVLLEVAFPEGEGGAADSADGSADSSVFEGIWECERASIEITQNGETSHCLVHWGSSAFETTVWEYDCTFDGEALTSPETGKKTNLIFSDDGSVEASEVVFDDGAARFRINEKGNLVWEDLKENAAEGMEFVHVGDMPSGGDSPTADAFADGYFRLIGGIETGTAGSSLKMAKAACDAVRFAADNHLEAADIETMRSEMLTAWEGLSDEERSAFDGNFMDVVMLLDQCMEDPASNHGMFEDAGAAEEMDALLADEAAMEAWRTLRDHTLTMGNSDGE